MKTKVFIVRAYKLIELARIYQVSKPTFKKWIKPFEDEIGEIIGHFLNYTQVGVIVKRIGLPPL